MSESSWSLTAADGELRILTGVAGRAAKMGHRLTIGMKSRQGHGPLVGGEPTSAGVDRRRRLSGGARRRRRLTPLAGPEKGVARSNALKSLDAPRSFRRSASPPPTSPQRRTATGSPAISRSTASRPQTVDVTVDDRGDALGLSAQVRLMQSDFGVKPYSLMMGALKVADEVTIDFSATCSR